MKFLFRAEAEIQNARDEAEHETCGMSLMAVPDF